MYERSTNLGGVPRSVRAVQKVVYDASAKPNRVAYSGHGKCADWTNKYSSKPIFYAAGQTARKPNCDGNAFFIAS